MESQEFNPLSPINFFQILFECPYIEPGQFPDKPKYSIPATSAICAEGTFATLYMGWNQEGIALTVQIKQPFKETRYPEITKGDSIELFFDTRDVKTSGFNTRFCHHFFFLPELQDGIQAGELTKFRTEDSHPLCDPDELKVHTQKKNAEYISKIWIPSNCLFGYDPDQFNRLGFTYRINRFKGEPQHFSVISDEYQLEQQPSLWSSVRLIK